MNKSEKLSISLQRQLTALFATATIAVVVVVVIGITIANLQIRDSASNFISSHVTSLVESGVGTQNVSDIDREVRRLYQAWSQTQKTDLRISVLVDGVLVGKAGPLAPFGGWLGWLSAEKVETKKLSSGASIVVRTETDFSKSATREILLIAIFVSCSIGGFFAVRRLISRSIQSLTTPLENRMAWLKDMALHLPESARGEILPADAAVEEIAQLDESLNAFVQQILRLEARVKEAGIKEGRVDMADRVAHALKGKLGVLRLRIENMSSLGANEKRKLLESVTGLMMSSREMLDAGRPLAQFEDKSLLGIVESAVQQRNQISVLMGLPERLEMAVEGANRTTVIPASFSTGLEDSIIAIIDNALEASERSQSIVHVICRFESDVARVSVVDSGCGIAPEILPRLMRERATFGKRNGNGLGLYHASEVMKKLGGNVEIESALGHGTTVSLVIKNSFEYEAAN